MKSQFFDYLFSLMKEIKDIYVIFVGLGYPRMDEFIKEFPGRAINSEASEQSALDMAVGLSLAGKTPFVYTISTFYWRGAETIRTYINHEKLPCVLIGAGVGEEYGKHDGFSHSGSDIKSLFNLFENVKQYYPDSKEEMEKAVLEAISNYKPNFINIHR